MPILLDTAETTYKEMSKILPRRSRRPGERRLRLPFQSWEELKRDASRLWAEMKDVLFEPRNPFDEQAKRKPHREVAFFAGLGFALVVVFVGSSLFAR